MVTSMLHVLNREQGEYLAHAYVDDPEVLHVDVVQVDGAWRVVVTSR